MDKVIYPPKSFLVMYVATKSPVFQQIPNALTSYPEIVITELRKPVASC